jgi:hypothetical protein
MGKPTTHVLLVTDKSGSMYSLAEDVRGGYNQYRQSLIDDAEVSYRVTSALFSTNHDYRVLCTAAAPADVPPLDATNYVPGGNTALLDAVGQTIVEFEAAVPQLGEGDRVLLVVQTDGRENASREYSAPAIKKMIAEREAGGAWSAVFMGAGQDTWQQSGAMGFATAVSYDNTAEGTHSAYAGLTQTSAAFARGATRGQAAAASGLVVESGAE